MSRGHHHYLVLEHFQCPKRKPRPIRQSLSIPPSSLATTELLSRRLSPAQDKNPLSSPLTMGGINSSFSDLCMGLISISPLLLAQGLISVQAAAVNPLDEKGHSYYKYWVLGSEQISVNNPDPTSLPSWDLLFRRGAENNKWIVKRVKGQEWAMQGAVEVGTERLEVGGDAWIKELCGPW